MPLRIIRECDPIEVTQLILAFHALPGLGKTSLGFTADDPLLIDFDRGVYRSQNRRDCFPVDRWEDLDELTQEALRPYKTIVIDTAGRAIDFLSSHIIRSDAKMGRNGVLSIQGFGRLLGMFTGWLGVLRTYGKDIVLLSHSSEQTKDDAVKIRLDVKGGSKEEVCKIADVIGHLYNDGNGRKIDFAAKSNVTAKSPVELGILDVPDYSEQPHFLGDLIRSVKATINAGTEQQRITSLQLNTWGARVNEAITGDDFASVLEALNGDTEVSDPMKQTIKKLIADSAKRKGFVYAKETKSFIEKAK